MTTYTTKDGDTVDYVCAKFYGSTGNGVVETVLLANPGLAEIGPELPGGTVITMPVISPKPKQIKRIFG